MSKITATISSFVLAAAVLAGCNTVAGAGEDIQKGGSAIEGAAQDAAN